MEKKAFCDLERVLCFLFCFVCEASFLQRCKLSAKSRTLLSSSRRNAIEFSSWASFKARWLKSNFLVINPIDLTPPLLTKITPFS